MLESISDKITLLNQTTLESLNEKDNLTVIKNFTETGLKILRADFGFAWWKPEEGSNYELAYKSPATPYEPNLPRKSGGNDEAQRKKKPVFISNVKAEDYEKEYDISPYMKSYCIIPVIYKDDIYGNLILCYKSGHNFLEEESSLASALGNAAAQAVTINRLLKSEQQARVAAENQEARFRELIENSYDFIALIDPEGKILDVSNSVSRIAGYESADLLEKNITEFIHQDSLIPLAGHMQKTMQEPDVPHAIELRYRHKDGSWRWMESVGENKINHPAINAIVANIRDVTERKEAENTIHHQALHDTLTGLPNRREFASRFSQALEAAKRRQGQMALMFLDMDRFKNVNDQLGHSVGDALLKVIATRIASSLRSEDVAARFGGDEFLILASEINSPKDAAIVADKILKAVALSVNIGEHIIHPGVSIGIAVYPDNGMDVEILKKNADIALYRAKDSGRNRYCFYDQALDNTEAIERFTLENDFRQALEYGQVEVYYQPIISLKRNKVIAVEALARWQHPDRGLLPPSEFIPFAEEAGLMGALDEYVLRQACGQIKFWQNMGMPKFRVAVNLSAQRFGEENFIDTVKKIIAETGCDPQNLEFEITEGVAMGDLELTVSNLKVLKKLGIHITIDDFGTGYSSLSYLKRFAINNLKIDKSFIRHCITNSQDTSITRAIIVIAHALNLKVIAEGIETRQQLDFLASLGCDAGQGFFIQAPMTAGELAAWMGEKNFKPQIMGVKQ